MTVTKDLIVFFWFIVEGIVGGIILDIIRALRHNRNMKNIMIYLEDFTYWLLLGGMVIWLNCVLDAGNIRMYMILGLFLGMFIYFLTFTNFTYKVLDFVCRYILKLIRWILNKFKGAPNEKESQLA